MNDQPGTAIDVIKCCQKAIYLVVSLLSLLVIFYLSVTSASVLPHELKPTDLFVIYFYFLVLCSKLETLCFAIQLLQLEQLLDHCKKLAA